MIRSMTGYGRGENSSGSRKFTVEIKSVNHRYNDISIKLPRSMNYLEDKIRKTLAKFIYRGKTDVLINLEMFSADNICIQLHDALAAAYVEKLEEAQRKYGLVSNDTLGIVMNFPDVLTVEKVQEDENMIWEILLPALTQAGDRFVAMREAEGEALKTDILKKSENIEEIVCRIRDRAPMVVEEYREKLKSKLEELLSGVEIDPQRLAAEVILFADRCCVDEELTRLFSHISQLRQILFQEGTVGRKLDFLVQEMNREANTTASKSNDILMTQATIELKSEIEKIREQIQNIE